MIKFFTAPVAEGAQQAVENDKLAQLQAVINLYKALGGGRN